MFLSLEPEAAFEATSGQPARPFVVPPQASGFRTRLRLERRAQHRASAANGRYATQLLKLRVDEIEVRAHVTGEDGKRQAVRLTASSMGGQCAGSRGRTG